MRLVLLSFLVMVVIGCKTVPVTDMPIKKDARGKMEPVRNTCFGLNVGKPYYRKITTSSDKTKAAFQRPALWCLSISLPLAIVSFACAIWLHNPYVSKKCAIAAGIAITVAIFSCVWLLATTYLLFFIPFCVLFVVFGYVKMKGRGFKWHSLKEKSDVN